MWRAVGEKRISQRLTLTCLSDIERDLTDGFLQRCGLDSVAHYRKALELSEQHASKYLTRALDVLHVGGYPIELCRVRGIRSAAAKFGVSRWSKDAAKVTVRLARRRI
jgi:nickel-dependent lactate racemase